MKNYYVVIHEFGYWAILLKLKLKFGELETMLYELELYNNQIKAVVDGTAATSCYADPEIKTKAYLGHHGKKYRYTEVEMPNERAYYEPNQTFLYLTDEAGSIIESIKHDFETGNSEIVVDEAISDWDQHLSNYSRPDLDFFIEPYGGGEWEFSLGLGIYPLTNLGVTRE